MFKYKISIDKKIIAILGPHLYGDTASILAELISNCYDADAHNCWVTIKTGEVAEVIIEDDGHGMTPEEVNNYFLDIGRDRRDMRPNSPRGRIVFGRKGIGKLAAFSLAKKIELYSLKDGKKAGCILDYEKITKERREPDAIPDKGIVFARTRLSKNGTGTRLVLKEIHKNINSTYYYLVNKIVRNFNLGPELLFRCNANATAFQKELARLGLKLEDSAVLGQIGNIRDGDSIEFSSGGQHYSIEKIGDKIDVYDLEGFRIHIAKNAETPRLIDRAALNYFDKMDTIVTIGSGYEKIREKVSSNPIPAKYKSITSLEDDNEMKEKLKMPRTIEVLDKDGRKTSVAFAFEGWVGTIVDRDGIKSLITNEGANEEEKKTISISDNRITIFSRRRIGEYDVLPKVHTTEVYDAYVIGEMHLDIFEDDRFVDMAISNRRGYEETDERYKTFIEDLKALVRIVVTRKGAVNKLRRGDQDKAEADKIRDEFMSKAQTKKILEMRLDPGERQVVSDENFQFVRAAKLAGNTKRVMISHSSDNKMYGFFIMRMFELLGVDVEKVFLFTSHAPTCVPHGVDIYDYLKREFRDDMYVIFLFSKHFYDSNMSIAETGAAWATNKEFSPIVIDINFTDIDKPINNSTYGLRMGDLKLLDRGEAKKFIKTVLSNIGLSVPDDAKILSSIETAIHEFSAKTGMDTFYPVRKFQGHPVCTRSGCGNIMALKSDASGVYYECQTPGCGNKLKAKIS